MINFINYHNTWHHACWLLNTDGIDSEEIKISTILFFDGKEENRGDVPKRGEVPKTITLFLLQKIFC